MTNQEILTKAIQKAIDGGWESKSFSAEIIVEGMINEPSEWWTLPDLMFDHDFAKALWGKEKQNYAPMGLLDDWDDEDYLYDDIKESWQYHLQQMVIAEDPIKYLGEHLDD